MNDNVYADSPHHAECLRLLNDLHDLFIWADAMGLSVDTKNESFQYAMDFAYWRQETGNVLAVSPVKISA